jgi:hypothetical protein
VRQLDLEISSPIWADVRAPAPWDSTTAHAATAAPAVAEATA